ncbi:type III-A CRISPR-associated protein Csm2 [Thermoflexus hugenholtzii]|jgi:CRISPR-associated protein, Csm2 family|uniref:CRISPR system Cms protein Csm2 n=1 Tax=Thermoflexus hugenholtzii JAD2 TaxID=877466 RepID=A0A212RQF8_9CHLR|nr:type III-A CRISPR-associated protein Csm2 [Thermoflexus hugenholtzii]SNB74702.1 CRISPR-associated protein, Csm2 family [Thermoflexus hugenholtzii JAD2]
MAGTAEFNLQDIDRIITQEDAAELLVKVSQALGRELARRKLTTHQLRNLFGEIRRIEKEWQQRQGQGDKLDPTTWRRLQLLKPRMAHQAARLQDRGHAMQPLIEVMERAIDRIEQDPERFRRFVDFFEAIVAYHRFYQEKR